MVHILMFKIFKKRYCKSAQIFLLADFSLITFNGFLFTRILSGGLYKQMKASEIFRLA